MHQKVTATVHTWKGHGPAPWGPIFSNIGPGPGPGGYPLWYPYHAAWPWLPIHSVGVSSSYYMFVGGVGGLLMQTPRAEPVIVYNQHGQMQKAIAMQHTTPPDAQNLTTSASQGNVPLASSQNSQVEQGSVPSSVGNGSASGLRMPSQHLGPSSSDVMGGSGDGGLQLSCTASTAVTDQFGRMQVAIQLSIPSIGQDPVISMEQNSTALPTWQGGLQLPCTVSTAGPDKNGRMKIAIELTIPDASESPSTPVQQNVLSSVATQCPLDPSTTFTSKKWTLEEVKEIESHIKTGCSCPHGPHPSLQDLVVTGLEDDEEQSTPLLMASLHGDLEAVKRIVEGWGISVCRTSVHSLSYCQVEGVTPLFLAASKCHTNIVRYILEKGGNVSARTQSTIKQFSGLTPLHIAFRFGSDHGDGVSDARISTISCLLEFGADPSALPPDGVPIWLNNDTEDGQIITLLVQWGLNLSQRAPHSGITPLHKWAGDFNIQHSNASLNVVKMLMDKGGDLQARGYDGFSVILKAAYGNGNLPNLPVFNFLLLRDDIARVQKIAALELAGAVILGNDENQEKFPLAFAYWRQALTLRLMDTNGCRPLYKNITKSKNRLFSEWCTMDDIMAIEQQPPLRLVHSLLVRLRILSCLSFAAVNDYYLPYLFKFLHSEAHLTRAFSQIVDISFTTIEQIVRFYPIESNLRSKSSDIIGELADNIYSMLEVNLDVNSAALETFLELIVMIDLYVSEEFLEANHTIGFHIYNVFDTLSILSTRPEMITENVKKSLMKLVQRDIREPSGNNILHFACSHLDPETTVSTVRFLLQLEAEPNVVNNAGNTPLHLLACQPGWLAQIRDETALLLLKSGAHLDAGNNKGKLPADLWLERHILFGCNVVWKDLPDWLKGNCPQLTCLCARIIRRHQLPFKDEITLPASLIPFIKMH